MGNPSRPVIHLTREGAVIRAFFGPSPMEGESETQKIAPPQGPGEEHLAAEAAADRLAKRLMIDHLDLPRLFLEPQGKT